MVDEANSAVASLAKCYPTSATTLSPHREVQASSTLAGPSGEAIAFQSTRDFMYPKCAKIDRSLSSRLKH